MTCTGRKGTWTIRYTFQGSERDPAIYAGSNEDDTPYFSNEGGRAILRSACDGRNMEPPYFAGSFSTVSIISEVFTPDHEDPPSGTAYDCVNGACLPKTTYNTPGLYATLSDCQIVCGGKGCSGTCVSNSDWAQIEGLAAQLRGKECG